jgi:hypothetical protein
MRPVLRLLVIPVFSLFAGAEDHWAYLPPVMPGIPQPASENPIDVLLGNASAKAGLSPAKSAPPKVWVQRAAYTLTGLPASKAQTERIEKNPDEATWLAIVEELLASPAYGERWARHWMDVARYADTQGYNFERDNRYPFAYTYRDWLINAFNKDLPYPDFIKLQIAADHLTDRPDHPDLAALGFLTVGPRAGNLETIDDRVDVVTRGFLSSTVSCARCHKHKFDPITMDDYYSIYSILENTDEPEDKPVIGEPADGAQFAAFKEERAKLEAADHAIRQEVVNQLHNPDSLGIYLELAWIARKQGWDAGAISSECVKNGRYRQKAVIRWRDFLNESAFSDNSPARLKDWNAAMENADEPTRRSLCTVLAQEWLGAADGSELKNLGSLPKCPLAFETHRIHELFDTEDGNKHGERKGAMTRLLIEHPGSLPRAMSLRDKEKWAPAQIYKRGDPSNRTDPIERQWLSFLGGGKFPDGKSPRLSLAEKIADPANPLTSRVMVNRVWAWHFGNALADPGDFGTQQSPPALLPLLDYLAIRFNESGGSLKDLHRLILSSKAFRLSADGARANARIDEANSLFWKWNRRRSDFEALRDSLLATSGSLVSSGTGGRSVSIDSENSDSRRSLYAFVDRYALATTFVSFDLPHPDQHAPKRIETSIPQQALYLLNSPLLIRQAEKLAASPDFQSLPDDAARIHFIYDRIYQRQPTEAELADMTQWLAAVDPADYAPRLAGAWEVRYARDTDGVLSEEQNFPMFHENSWRTGTELAKAPIRFLNVGAQFGHTADGFSPIIRWRAHSSGQVKLDGEIKRTQKDGTRLEWKIFHNGRDIATTALGSNQTTPITSEWLDVTAGSTVDFVLRAPEPVNNCSTSWTLSMTGRENPDSHPRELGNFKDQFPKNNNPPPTLKPSSPWADIIQMLWASNEFNFIE